MIGAHGPERHRRRGAIATRLLDAAPDAAAALDWDAIDRAPAWLAVAGTELALEQRRIGATLNAAAIRLWIDRRRLAAARHAVGDAFLRALLADPTAADLARRTAITPDAKGDGAVDIAEWLRQAGAAVQAASMSDGALGQAAGIALCGCAGASPQLPAQAARALIDCAMRIGAASDSAAKERIA